jgi:hypothetical protein
VVIMPMSCHDGAHIVSPNAKCIEILDGGGFLGLAIYA